MRLSEVFGLALVVFVLIALVDPALAGKMLGNIIEGVRGGLARIRE